MIISKKRFSAHTALWIIFQMHLFCQMFVHGIPVNIEPTDHGDSNYPIAYNLYNLAEPRDINNLEVGNNDLVKRALYDVTATINEVQRLLNADPRLPRLTRGEIEDLLEKVTKEELDKSIKDGNKRKEKRMRALMLVLPFNTDNTSSESLQDLYTRAPITKMVTAGSKKTNYKNQQQILNLPSQTGKVEIISTPYLTEVDATTYRPHKQKKVLTTTKQTTTTRVVTTTQQPLQINQKAHFAPTQLPIPGDPTVRPDGKFSSHYSGDIPLKPSAKPAPIRENVKDILASIGLYADDSQKSKVKATTTRKPTTVSTTVTMPFFYLKDTTTTTTPSPSTTRKPITPELEQLLKTFGFLNGNSQQPFKPLPPSLHEGNLDKLIMTPEIHADDYSAFKPLPEKAQPKPLNSDMEEFLKTFGLLDLAAGDVNRKKKSMKTDEVPSTSKKVIPQMEEMPEISADYLTPEMKKVLDNLGVGMVESVKPKHKTRLQSADEEDLKKLQELFETVKQLDALNSTLTAKDFEQLDLGRFNFSDSLLASGPDPFDHDEHFQSKNEIKRQQEGSEPTRFSLDLNTTTEDSDDAAVTESIVPAVITETKNSALDDVDMDSDTDSDAETTTAATSTSTSQTAGRNDLSDSFPGGVDPIPEEDLPPPRRNGFYFLADWNSFLEVGEDPNRVVVRFDPKVGDSSRFLPVNVP